MPLAPFPLYPNGRPPGRYDLAPPKWTVTEHKFSDHIERNRESDVAERRVTISYAILYPVEVEILDDHYNAAQEAGGFDFTERESNVTYADVLYLDYKKTRDGTIERREITLIWFA